MTWIMQYAQRLMASYLVMAAIYHGISEETLFLLAKKEMTKEVWEALKMMHLGANRVKQAQVQTL